MRAAVTPALLTSVCVSFSRLKKTHVLIFYFLIARESAPSGGYVYVSCLAVGQCRAYSRSGSVSGVLPVCTARSPVIPSVSV